MQYITTTEAKSKLLEIIREIQDAQERYIITRKGKPGVVLMSFDEFEGWLETVGILKDQELLEQINSAREARKNGRSFTLEETFSIPVSQ